MHAWLNKYVLHKLGFYTEGRMGVPVHVCIINI